MFAMSAVNGPGISPQPPAEHRTHSCRSRASARSIAYSQLDAGDSNIRASMRPARDVQPLTFAEDLTAAAPGTGRHRRSPAPGLPPVQPLLGHQLPMHHPAPAYDPCPPADRGVDAARPIRQNPRPRMAGVAQLVERQVVVLDAVGSSPIARPTAHHAWRVWRRPGAAR